MAEFSTITVARFWSKVDVRPSEFVCWEWEGSFSKNGYGGFALDGKTTSAHKVAYMIFNGCCPPDGILIRHTCDNPKCVNPRHLETGTHRENFDDYKSRQRPTFEGRVGEDNGRAKLTEEQVETVRDRIARGETNVRIAKSFGVTHAAISAIRRGKSWQSVRNRSEEC